MSKKNDWRIHTTQMVPTNSVPVTTPQYCTGLYNAEPNAIKQYLFTYIYVWTENGFSFWLFPICLRDDIIYGYIWEGESWIYSTVDRSLILSVY